MQFQSQIVNLNFINFSVRKILEKYEVFVNDEISF